MRVAPVPLRFLQLLSYVCAGNRIFVRGPEVGFGIPTLTSGHEIYILACLLACLLARLLACLLARFSSSSFFLLNIRELSAYTRRLRTLSTVCRRVVIVCRRVVMAELGISNLLTPELSCDDASS